MSYHEGGRQGNKCISNTSTFEAGLFLLPPACISTSLLLGSLSSLRERYHQLSKTQIGEHAFELGSVQRYKALSSNNPGFSETSRDPTTATTGSCSAENTRQHLHLNKLLGAFSISARFSTKSHSFQKLHKNFDYTGQYHYSNLPRKTQTSWQRYLTRASEAQFQVRPWIHTSGCCH